MTRKGLTVSFIIEGESANYGESTGNISNLKKISRNDGEMYSYISRQALRYNIIQQMAYDNTPVQASGSGEKTVIQFHPDATVEDYPEIDLFGYMKTTKDESANTRSAVVRLSNAVALEAYRGDMDFLTNAGLAARQEGLRNSIAQSEIHKGFYAYTIAVDLDSVGVDGEIQIADTEKARRILNLLDTLKFLYRDIRGRRENLSPVFAIGGVYSRKNPFFENRLRLNRLMLDVNLVQQVLNLDTDVRTNTYIGCLDGVFLNNQEIKEQLNPLSINEFFEKMKKEVEAYYV